MFNVSDIVILLDTEYTAWEGSRERNWSGECEHREIVQIAAIKIDTKSLDEIESFCVLVKPTLNSKLSDYFINLTGITQEQINQHGVDFAQALKMYSDWSRNFDTYSFGRDEKVLAENCELVHISFTLTNNFFDTRDVFFKYGIPAQKYYSGNIVEAFGVKNARTQHDALNDTRTVLDGLKLLSKKIGGVC